MPVPWTLTDMIVRAGVGRPSWHRWNWVVGMESHLKERPCHLRLTLVVKCIEAGVILRHQHLDEVDELVAIVFQVVDCREQMPLSLQECMDGRRKLYDAVINVVQWDSLAPASHTACNVGRPAVLARARSTDARTIGRNA